jgi:peptide/nickel transport system permease protein
MSMGGTIMGAAGLSYIGLGIPADIPEWGAMISAARGYSILYPHMMIFPGLMIAIVVLAINLFGDGLRDAMDPKLKK